MNFLQRLCFIFPDLILLGSIILHLYLCPFTKVEESFNMQAGYDLQHLNFLSELKDFDHLEFSGVVPRTFLGALVMTLMSYPVQILNETFLPLVGNVPFLPSSVYRLSLGVMVWLSFCYFRRGIHISNKFSSRTGAIFSVLLAMQFHIPYYASRTLPNTFALAIVMVAYGLWFRNKPIKCLYCIGVATVLFRCDMLVLLAPMAMQMLVFEQVPLVSTFFSGVAVCVLTLILSVLVDSYFWMRLLWPEGEVLFFNTVENRSSEWGTFPFHWYFTSALPKALHTSLPLVVVGLLNPCQNTRNERSSIWYYLWPTLSFLVLYSFLPHKELRFVFPAIPMFTLAAARGLDSMLPAALFGRYTGTTSNKSEPVGVFRGVCSTVLLIGIISLAVSVTSVFSVASQHNYPGGQALTKLNEHILSSSREFCITDSFSPPSPLQECAMRPDMDCLPIVRIHIDAAAAMSGINRFGQIQDCRVLYSKNESDFLEYDHFDWLITGDPRKKEISILFTTWLAVSSFDGFYIDHSVLNEIKDILRGGMQILIQKVKIDVVDTDSGLNPWTIVKLCIKRFSPLKIRFKDEIFVMKRSEIISSRD